MATDEADGGQRRGSAATLHEAPPIQMPIERTLKASGAYGDVHEVAASAPLPLPPPRQNATTIPADEEGFDVVTERTRNRQPVDRRHMMMHAATQRRWLPNESSSKTRRRTKASADRWITKHALPFTTTTACTKLRHVDPFRAQTALAAQLTSAIGHTTATKTISTRGRQQKRQQQHRSGRSSKKNNIGRRPWSSATNLDEQWIPYGIMRLSQEEVDGHRGQLLQYHTLLQQARTAKTINAVRALQFPTSMGRTAADADVMAPVNIGGGFTLPPLAAAAATTSNSSSAASNQHRRSTVLLNKSHARRDRHLQVVAQYEQRLQAQSRAIRLQLQGLVEELRTERSRQSTSMSNVLQRDLADESLASLPFSKFEEIRTYWVDSAFARRDAAVAQLGLRASQLESDRRKHAEMILRETVAELAHIGHASSLLAIEQELERSTEALNVHVVRNSMWIDEAQANLRLLDTAKAAEFTALMKGRTRVWRRLRHESLLEQARDAIHAFGLNGMGASSCDAFAGVVAGHQSLIDQGMALLKRFAACVPPDSLSCEAVALIADEIQAVYKQQDKVCDSCILQVRAQEDQRHAQVTAQCNELVEKLERIGHVEDLKDAAADEGATEEAVTITSVTAGAGTAKEKIARKRRATGDSKEVGTTGVAIVSAATNAGNAVAKETELSASGIVDREIRALESKRHAEVTGLIDRVEKALDTDQKRFIAQMDSVSDFFKALAESWGELTNRVRTCNETWQEEISQKYDELFDGLSNLEQKLAFTVFQLSQAPDMEKLEECNDKACEILKPGGQMERLYRAYYEESMKLVMSHPKDLQQCLSSCRTNLAYVVGLQSNDENERLVVKEDAERAVREEKYLQQFSGAALKREQKMLQERMVEEKQKMSERAAILAAAAASREDGEVDLAATAVSSRVSTAGASVSRASTSGSGADRQKKGSRMKHSKRMSKAEIERHNQAKERQLEVARVRAWQDENVFTVSGSVPVKEVIKTRPDEAMGAVGHVSAAVHQTKRFCAKYFVMMEAERFVGALLEGVSHLQETVHRLKRVYSPFQETVGIYDEKMEATSTGCDIGTGAAANSKAVGQSEVHFSKRGGCGKKRMSKKKREQMDREAEELRVAEAKRVAAEAEAKRVALEEPIVDNAGNICFGRVCIDVKFIALIVPTLRHAVLEAVGRLATQQCVAANSLCVELRAKLGMDLDIYLRKLRPRITRIQYDCAQPRRKQLQNNATRYERLVKRVNELNEKLVCNVASWDTYARKEWTDLQSWMQNACSELKACESLGRIHSIVKSKDVRLKKFRTLMNQRSIELNKLAASTDNNVEQAVILFMDACHPFTAIFDENVIRTESQARILALGSPVDEEDWRTQANGGKKTRDSRRQGGGKSSSPSHVVVRTDVYHPDEIAAYRRCTKELQDQCHLHGQSLLETWLAWVQDTERSCQVVVDTFMSSHADAVAEVGINKGLGYRFGQPKRKMGVRLRALYADNEQRHAQIDAHLKELTSLVHDAPDDANSLTVSAARDVLCFVDASSKTVRILKLVESLRLEFYERIEYLQYIGNGAVVSRPETIVVTPNICPDKVPILVVQADTQILARTGGGDALVMAQMEEEAAATSSSRARVRTKSSSSHSGGISKRSHELQQGSSKKRAKVAPDAHRDGADGDSSTSIVFMKEAQSADETCRLEMTVLIESLPHKKKELEEAAAARAAESAAHDDAAKKTVRKRSSRSRTAKSRRNDAQRENGSDKWDLVPPVIDAFCKAEMEGARKRLRDFRSLLRVQVNRAMELFVSLPDVVFNDIVCRTLAELKAGIRDQKSQFESHYARMKEQRDANDDALKPALLLQSRELIVRLVRKEKLRRHSMDDARDSFLATLQEKFDASAAVFVQRALHGSACLFVQLSTCVNPLSLPFDDEAAPRRRLNVKQQMREVKRRSDAGHAVEDVLSTSHPLGSEGGVAVQAARAVESIQPPSIRQPLCGQWPGLALKGFLSVRNVSGMEDPDGSVTASAFSKRGPLKKKGGSGRSSSPAGMSRHRGRARVVPLLANDVVASIESSKSVDALKTPAIRALVAARDAACSLFRQEWNAARGKLVGFSAEIQRSEDIFRRAWDERVRCLQ